MSKVIYSFNSATKEQLRQRIRISESRIADLQSQINTIKAATPQFDRDVLNAKLSEADRLRAEIEPEYNVYMKRVDAASQELNDCKIERIKL